MIICRWRLDLAHTILQELAELRRENTDITYLRPDAKSQVTLEYDDNNQPIRIDAIVVSTQHDDFGSEEEMQRQKSRHDIISNFDSSCKREIRKVCAPVRRPN